MDDKINYYSGWFSRCSIWHYAGAVCGIWWCHPCGIMAGNFENISCKYRYGIHDSSHSYDCICVFYDRSQIHIGTILYQIVYSFCVDLFANAHVYSTHIWVNALIMLLGIVLFAIGTGFYAAASLGRGSYEALTFSLAEKNNWQVKIVRMVLDVVMVATGVMLGGKFGICTIVTILISGPVIQFTAAKTKKLICVACGNDRSDI